jgi:hypothetical protein
MSNTQSVDSAVSKHDRVRLGAWPEGNQIFFNIFQVNIIIYYNACDDYFYH